MVPCRKLVLLACFFTGCLQPGGTDSSSASAASSSANTTVLDSSSGFTSTARPIGASSSLGSTSSAPSRTITSSASSGSGSCVVTAPDPCSCPGAAGIEFGVCWSPPEGACCCSRPSLCPGWCGSLPLGHPCSGFCPGPDGDAKPCDGGCSWLGSACSTGSGNSCCYGLECLRVGDGGSAGAVDSGPDGVCCVLEGGNTYCAPL